MICLNIREIIPVGSFLLVGSRLKTIAWRPHGVIHVRMDLGRSHCMRRVCWPTL